MKSRGNFIFRLLTTIGLFTTVVECTSILRRTTCPSSLPTAAPFQCGRVQVPLDYSQPFGEQLQIFVAVLNGDLNSFKSQALTIIQGGPGFSTSSLAAQSFPLLSSFQALQQPIVVVDYRGTGFSGALVCQPVSLLDDIISFNKRCGLSLGPQRIFYNNANAARDYERVRRALKILKWNMIAISYGTQIARRYASFFPYFVRTLVLDGAFALDDFLLNEEALFSKWTQVLRKVCNRTGFCSAQDTLRQLDQVLQNLRLDPVSGLPPSTLAPLAFELPLIQNFTSAVAQAATQNFTPLQQLFAAFDDQRTRNVPDVKVFSLGLQQAMACLEIERPWDKDDCECTQIAKAEAAILRRNSQSYGPFRPSEFTGFLTDPEACLGWPRLPLGVNLDRLVPEFGSMIEVRTLVLTGELDLITPPQYGRDIAKTIEDARFVEIANAGHVLLLKSACARGLMFQFVKTAAFPDASNCTNPLKQPFAP